MKAILFLTAMWFASATLGWSQQIDVGIEIYRGDEQIIDAFQAKLFEGGDAAIQAAARLPDLVKGRRLTVEETLEFSVNSGQRVKHASSKEMLTLHREENYEVVDGLEVEMDPVLSTDGEAVDLNLAASWARKDGREVLMNRATLSFMALSGVPVLLQRWTEGDESFLMMLTASAADKIGKALPANSMVYLDVAVYENAVDAQGKRNAVARMVFPSRSGQRVKTEHYRPIFYDVGGGAIESCNVGLIVETDATVGEDGKTVALQAAVSSSDKPGGTERSADGIRVPRVTFHDGSGALTIASGSSAPLALRKKSLVDVNAQPGDWQAVLSATVYNGE